MKNILTTLIFSLLLAISVFAQSPTDRIQRSGGKIQVVNDGSIVVTLASGKTFKITPQASLPVTCTDGQFAFKTNTGLHQCVNGAWLQLTSGSASAVTSFNTRTGVVTLSSIDVTDALTYTPVPPTRTVNGHALSGNVTVSKSDVGLGNADNTSDANKPVSTATQTALDLKENVANKSTDIAADAASNTKYGAVKAIADYVAAQIAALPVGVTNSAGADVVPVSDGTNLGASGTDATLTGDNSVSINSGNTHLVLNGNGDIASLKFGTATKVDVENHVVTLGGTGNNTLVTVDDTARTITASVGTESIAVDGVGHTLALTAMGSITHTTPSFSVVSPLFGAGDNGSRFQINENGKISKYADSAPADGDIPIGSTANGEYRVGTIVGDTGISATYSGGSFHIANTQPGAAIACSNTAASTAITGTASKTYFNLRCPIPANTLTAGKTIKLEARGVYSSAVANTLVNAVDLCQVDGCASGTVVNLATTAAVTPGAITNQGWLLDENSVQYTAGATGTVDTQGYAAYQTASLVITFDPTPNTSTSVINTTVDQYLSVAVTWSTNSGSNSITLRNWKVVVQ